MMKTRLNAGHFVTVLAVAGLLVLPLYSALSSMLIYLVMAIVLVVRPEGLFPANRR